MSDAITKKYYTISQASKQLGVSKATLRRWEKTGKISSTVDEHGIHLYTTETLDAHTQPPHMHAHQLPQSTSTLLTAGAAARLGGISKATLLRWELAGLIQSTRTAGGARRYESEAIAKLMNSRTTYQRVPKDEQMKQKISKLYKLPPTLEPVTQQPSYPTIEMPAETPTPPPESATIPHDIAKNRFTKPLFLTGILVLALAGTGFLAVQIAVFKNRVQRSVAPHATVTNNSVADALGGSSSLLQGNVLGTGTVGLGGSTGPTGELGPMGAEGPTGGTGFAGLSGDQGPTGSTGTHGPSGVSGPTGPTGTVGATGPTGLAGAAGTTGATGQIGADGENLFAQLNNIIMPYPVVDRSLALGSSTGGGQATTATSSALIFLNGSATGNNGYSWINSGNVGIGTTAPAYTLDVKTSGTGVIARFTSDNATGCLLATDGTISCTSDERLKKNIENISYGVDTLMTLRPVTFDWKSGVNEEKNLGFIAQEIESILPGLVTTDSATGYKQFNMTGLIPILTRAIQQQQKQITSLAKTFNSQVLISPLSEIEEVRTNILSPLSDTTAGIGVKLGSHQSLTIYNKEGMPTTSFDSLGNASFTGTLSSGALESDSISASDAQIDQVHSSLLQTDQLLANDATFSGTLYADRIMTRFGELINSTPPAPLPIIPPMNFTDSDVSSASTLLALGATLTGDNFQHVTIDKDIILTESFTAFGDTFLGNTTIGGSLTVDGSIHVSGDGIETYGSTLYIQPKKLASLDIMGGTIIVTNSGNVIINGNLNLSGYLAAVGGVSTSVLSPIDDNVTINLSKHLQTTSIFASSSGELALRSLGEGGFGKLLIQGPGGYTVTAFDAAGNATLSGSLAARQLLTNKLHLTSLIPGASASATVEPSVGQGEILPGAPSVTITNASVTDESLVFITPTSPTTHTIYVVDKQYGEFTVGMAGIDTEPVRFNWWIIN